MSKAGDPPDRIAAKLHVDVAEVESIIREFEAARASVSSDIVDMVVNAEVLTAMSGVGDRIQQAMSARRFTGAYDQAGDPVYDPDHSLALEAIKTTRELAEVSKPKGGGVNVAVGINNNGNGNGSGNGQGRSFEAMVRLAEQKRKLELGDGGVATIPAEFTENEPDDDDEPELDDPDDAGLDDDEDDE